MELLDMLKNVLGYITSGYDFTILLLVMICIDFILGIRWRVAKNQSILSHAFIGGLLTNITAGLLPAILELVNHLSFHTPNPVFEYAAAFISICIGLAMAQSIIANWKLSGYPTPAFLDDFINKYIQPEMSSKQVRSDQNGKTN